MENNQVETFSPPQRFGLANDPEFRRVRLAATDPRVLRWIGPQKAPVAAMVATPEKISQFLPVTLFLPLCGLSESPLLGAEDWSDERYRDFVEALCARYDWDMCRVCALTPEQSEKIAAACDEEGLRYRKVPYFSRVISGFNSFEEYFRSRSRSFRSSTSGALRKIVQGGFEFSDYVGVEEWRELYRKRHPFMPEADYSILPQFHQFMGRLIETLKDSGRLLQIGLWRKGQIAAAMLGLRFNGLFYFYQTAHDPELRSCRPGAVVFCKMLERAFEQKPCTIAFQSDAEYLSHYTDQAYALIEIEIFSRRPAARVLGLYRSFKNSKQRVPVRRSDRPEIHAAQ